MVKNQLKVKNLNTRIWNENGIVKQSGCFNLPEVLAEFKEIHEAEAYINGMLDLANILS